jgi:SAM-dependent methyltransferase
MTSLSITSLAQHIARNRFLPIPPEEQNFVGDGQFLAIGCEFLQHFVAYGNLAPHHRVLDIGSGIGRMALPLTQYLDDTQGGAYEGFDIVAHGVAWCQEHISRVYPAFRFQHLDLYNSLYNNGGQERLENKKPLPYEDASFDFIFLTSVFTHLTLEDMLYYLGQIKRLLRPGGKALITAFLVTPLRQEALEKGLTRPVFAPPYHWPYYTANPAHPMAAVAVAEDYFSGMVQYFGLEHAHPVVYGNWAGEQSAVFQDITVLQARKDTPDA